MPTVDEFVEAGRLVAGRFGLEPTDVCLLSMSENVVLELRSDPGRAESSQSGTTPVTSNSSVMRFHRPGYNSLDELRSEVAWVQSFRGGPVPVPTAVRAAGGDYYHHVEVGDEARYVGVVEWVHGQPLGGASGGGREDVDMVSAYRRIGELAGHIRAHNEVWVPPANFTRRRWDADGLMGERPLWGRFWEAAGLDAEQRALFTRARDRLRDELATVSTDADRFGLIHADLHLGNLMADGDRLTVIDFDDAGYGWFVYELAVALRQVVGEPYFDDARRSLFEGYRSVVAFDEDEEQLVDTFLLVRALLIVGWMAARPELELPIDVVAEAIADAVKDSERYLTQQG